MTAIRTDWRHFEDVRRDSDLRNPPKFAAPPMRGFGAGMSARDFISPTAGRAGSAETAEAKDAAVRPEVKR